MDLGFGPDEWLGVGIVGFNEVIDVLPELFDRGEGRVVEGLPLQDREPDFDLVEPGSPRRREMETHVGMTLEPAVVFGLVGVEVVEDDMDGGVRMSGDDVVHEIGEFDASPTIRDFVPWRFSDAGGRSAWIIFAFRRPKTCTSPEVS